MCSFRRIERSSGRRRIIGEVGDVLVGFRCFYDGRRSGTRVHTIQPFVFHQGSLDRLEERVGEMVESLEVERVHFHAELEGIQGVVAVDRRRFHPFGIYRPLRDRVSRKGRTRTL